MIYDLRELPRLSTLRADACVVGAGAGGLAAAHALSFAGLRVVVVEHGAFVPPDAMNQREADMLPLLYADAAGRTARDRRIRIHQGKGVGGSTLHNLNLCKRIDPAILARWHRERPLAQLDPPTWERLFDEVEGLLGVTDVDPALWNRHNRLFADACRSLGWRWSGLRHNRAGCVGSGYCELGCAFDAKNNAAKVLLPDAVDRGAIVVHHAHATEIVAAGGRAVAVEVRSVDDRADLGDRHLRVDAGAIVIAASATGTAALLRRSDVPDPSRLTGRQLAIHPAVVAAGEFAEPVHAWRGIPQTVECTEFLREEEGGDRPARRLWIVPAFGHPVGTATMMPGHGAVHRAFMARYAHLGVLCAMLHDHGRGGVEAQGPAGVAIDYALSGDDRRELRAGVGLLARALFAAGARRVWLPLPEPLAVDRLADLRDLTALDPADLGLTAVHPMATCPMSDDPARGPVDSSGRHHGWAGLWVADGSLYPSSIGGPPQLGIYALGLHVGRSVARALGRAGA